MSGTGTGSGTKTIYIETRERAVSNDFNRLQAFINAHMAEVLRHLFDVRTSEDYSGGTEGLGSSVTNPLRGVILSGLRCRPEVGTTNLFVEPGVALLVDPDASPSADDSPLKWIVSEGEQQAGALTLPAAAGTARVDMVECRRRPETELEASNRDIYDTATRTFTPQLITKVAGFPLEFRVRTGTAGGGFAGLGTETGWLPLMVFVTPPGATTWDDVEFCWDVRPLASDHTEGPFAVERSYPQRDGRRQYGLLQRTDADDYQLNGFFDTSYQGRRIGGQIGAEDVFPAGYADMADYREPGWGPSANSMTYIYCATPFGLPRWAQYTQAPALRVPGPFRGIIVQSTQPCEFDGTPLNDVALPLVTSLGGDSSEMRLIACQPYSSQLIGVTVEDGWFTFGGSLTAFGFEITPSAGNTALSTDFELLDDQHIPRIATAARVRVRKQLSALATEPEFATWDLLVPNQLSANALVDERRNTVVANGLNFWELELPLRSQYPYPTVADGRGQFTHVTSPASAATVDQTRMFFRAVKLAL